MPSCTVVAPAWPDPGRFALALVLAFTLVLVSAWAWGDTLVKALLPITQDLLTWLDDRFGVVSLEVERNAQDTVVRMRAKLTTLLVLGGQVIPPHPKGWIEASTPVGDLLQPLVIATGFALAWPGMLPARLFRLGIAIALGLLFLVIDIPITLHAVVWDMLVFQLRINEFSPLLTWWQFTQAGGRLGIGLVMGVVAWQVECAIGNRCGKQSPVIVSRTSGS